MPSDTWLITGGAGYIGSHVVRAFADAGFSAVVLDDMSTGIAERIPSPIDLVPGDCRDAGLVREVLLEYEVSGIVHLAARKQARESSRIPVDYWSRNVGSVLGVVQAIPGTSVSSLILSSSCSVYGAVGPVGPGSRMSPISPYGRTKLTSEWIVRDAQKELSLGVVILRYFNVIGNGDFPYAFDTSPECLVPAAFERINSGRRPLVFGTDFETPDGTALRDYIDVRDLAIAHVSAAHRLVAAPGIGLDSFDLGTGSAVSVRAVLTSLADSMGVPLAVEDVGRNEADPPSVWVDSSTAKAELNWSPIWTAAESVRAYVQAKRSSSLDSGASVRETTESNDH